MSEPEAGLGANISRRFWKVRPQAGSYGNYMSAGHVVRRNTLRDCALRNYGL